MATFGELRATPLTTWPVITETLWLLRESSQAVNTFLSFIAEGGLDVVDLDVSVAKWLARFFIKFSDVKPDLADATLVYVAEQLGIETVFTLDRRDFCIYRLDDGRALTLLPE